MKLLEKLKSFWQLPKMNHPQFGEISFQENKRLPENSYWEIECDFPKTKSKIFLALPGYADKPFEEGVELYNQFVGRFDEYLELAKPLLAENFQMFVRRDLNEDLSKDLEFTSYCLEGPISETPTWEMCFEKREIEEEDWFYFTVVFEGQKPITVVVDS